MWTLPFLVPFKAPPIPSFHAEALAAALGLLALSALPVFAGRLELPRVALLPLGFTGLIVLQMVLGRLPYPPGRLARCTLPAVGDRPRHARRTAPARAGARARRGDCWPGFFWSGALAQRIHRLGSAHRQRRSRALHDAALAGPGVGNLGQPNQLADYLALGLASVALPVCHATGLPLRWARAGDVGAGLHPQPHRLTQRLGLSRRPDRVVGRLLGVWIAPAPTADCSACAHWRWWPASFCPGWTSCCSNPTCRLPRRVSVGSRS